MSVSPRELTSNERTLQSPLKMMFIKFLSFLLAITSVSALGLLQKFHKPKTNQRTMKTILQSCYAKENLSNGILIHGDFDEVIDELVMVRVEGFMNEDNIPHWPKNHPFTHPLALRKASVLVFIADSPAELGAIFGHMYTSPHWDHMAPFFIFGKKNETCGNATDFLRTAWEFDILNAVYICTESTSKSALYTLNPITDYAPHPWKKVEGADDLNAFRQPFDPDISCQHLNYDKTKFLNGYQIRAVTHYNAPWVIPGKNYYEEFSRQTQLDYRVVRLIVEALNASCRFELEKTREAEFDRCLRHTSDLMADLFSISSTPDLSFLFPQVRSSIVAVIKLNPEVSTADKILHLWSPTVLIMAAVAIAILFLILTIKNRSPSVAMLDLTRLLIYTSILTNHRTHSFRIYLTTMLIFMVISNGVFQGKIAAFLTTRERVPAPETIDELVKLNYKMYVFSGAKSFAKRGCPKCNLIETSPEECVQFALNGNLQACVMPINIWYHHYSLKPLDYVKRPLNEELEGFSSRRYWPLYNRFNYMVMRLVESGIIDHWMEELQYAPRGKREAMEEEWSSPEYRPVKLFKLDFSFQLLALGLSLATIVFVLELIASKYLQLV